MADKQITKERHTRRVDARFTPTEMRMLEELSAATGLSQAAVVRQAVRAYATLRTRRRL